MDRRPVTHLALAVLLVLAAGPAAGQTNEIGIYYDAAATEVEGFRPANEPFDLYFCLTDLSSPVILGFEFGYTVEEWGAGGHLSRLAAIMPAGTIDAGDSADLASGDYVVSLSVPLLGSAAVVAVR